MSLHKFFFIIGFAGVYGHRTEHSGISICYSLPRFVLGNSIPGRWSYDQRFVGDVFRRTIENVGEKPVDLDYDADILRN
jgi:hypothetical protein